MCDLFLMGWVLEQRNSRRRPRAFIRAHLWQLAQAWGRGRVVLFQVGEEQGWEGVPPPQISQFCGVLKFLLLSLPPLCLNIKPLPDGEHHLLLKRSWWISLLWAQVAYLKNRVKGIMPPVRGTGENIGNVQCLAPRSPMNDHYFLSIIY